MAASIVMHNALVVRYNALLLAAIVLGSLGGCGGDKLVELGEPDPSTFFWGLNLDLQSATLAVGGTQHVVATPRNAEGNRLDGVGVPVFRSQDPAKVTVTQDGVITALTETDGTAIIASLTTQGITHADTTMIVVTAESHTIASFEIVQEPGDTVLAHGDSRTITVLALDENEQPIDGLALELVSLDPTVLAAADGELLMYATGLGTGRVVAKTTSYGVTVADTVHFKVGYAMVNYFLLQTVDADTALAFTPDALVIGVNGVVFWQNYGLGPAQVIFENDRENIEGGDILDLQPYESDVSRKFLAAGTYRFTNPLNGKKGRVVVRENP